MKTVTGRVVSEEPISLTTAANILSGFVASKNGASQDVSAYLRRAAAAFTELKSMHREINSSSLKGKKKLRSEARNEQNQIDEFKELDRAKGIDDLVGNGGEIRFRKSEIVREEESICGQEQDEIKEDKKKKKKKSKKNKEEDVVDEKLEDEQRNEERKERKKKKKKSKEEDVIDEKVNEKLEDEQMSEEREERKKEKKKRRKSDGETNSEERKSKKKRKSKEIDG
ncbi:unnamed protein product [Thlaspi arvense]|uniref:Uncharacterized protein n=1 Tax=Thlaspi arvense TaxID=13288 RepID=A0AAU9SNJ7_THLAR|nr:unnamed protein product [Thlaspi arvense]